MMSTMKTVTFLSRPGLGEYQSNGQLINSLKPRPALQETVEYKDHTIGHSTSDSASG